MIDRAHNTRPKGFLLAFILASILLGAACPMAMSAPEKSPQGSRVVVFGAKNYEWGKLLPEQAEILKLTGDAARGKEAFRSCSGCHKPDGGGLIDGTYPRLSGQHASVVIKQVTEVRAGVRANSKMAPFSSQHAVTLQEIADIAVYLETLDSVHENGKGPGSDLARGKKLYLADSCASCHGDRGEGKAMQAYPVVASQHFGYLVRELELIQKGQRGNSHPTMVKAIEKYSRQDMEAVADYMSRMPDYRLGTSAGSR